MFILVKFFFLICLFLSKDKLFKNVIFFHLETSLPAKQNDIARLVSLPVPASNVYCLSFWYHMRGQHIDTLNVYTQLTSDSNNETIVWSKKGNQGNLWMNGRISLTSDDEYKIVFEGIRGVSYEGDIALVSFIKRKENFIFNKANL